MPTKAAAKKKALTLSDIAMKAERWSKHQRDIAALDREGSADPELTKLIERHALEMRPFVEKYAEKIEALEEKSEVLQAEIFAWFATRAKSVKVESRHAIAELAVGTKLGNRQIDVKKLTELCKKKGVDVTDVISIMVQRCDALLGKKEIDAIATRDQVPSRTQSLKLK